MKALIWKGDARLDYEHVPDPSPAAEEVVLDIELAGICGSDLHGYRGHPGPRIPPLVLGHEAVGRFEGERFVVFPLIGCGECERCRAGEENLCARWQLVGMQRPGVFAERVGLPRSTLVAVPDALSSERAVLCEPLACAVGALSSHPASAGTCVVVLGCGPIGLLTILLAAGRGTDVLAVDPLAERRALAERLGARVAVHDASELAPGEADLVIDAAGFEASWAAALALVRSGGQVVVLGLGEGEGTFPMTTLIRRGIHMRGQFAYSRADFAEALRALADRDMDLAWLTTQPLAEGAQAFARLVDEPARYAKILLAPSA